MENKKTVLITGAAGFIGFHTAVALHQAGADVLGLDNFNSYYSPLLKRRRAEKLKELGIHVIEIDLNDGEKLSFLFNNHPFTHVLHLAAQAGVRYSLSHPEAYLASNINGFLALLEQLRRFPHLPLIYASSSSVYGTNQKIPFSVIDRTDQPANLYAATKKANELMAYTYQHLYGIRTIGLRFFTVYGPWGRPDMAYYCFTRALLTGRPLSLFNQGKARRDFTYIDDIVTGILAALNYSGPHLLFNLGGSHPSSVLELVTLLEKLLGCRANLLLQPPQQGEVETTYADLSESLAELHFQPRISLEEGLSHFLSWYQAEAALQKELFANES